MKTHVETSSGIARRGHSVLGPETGGAIYRRDARGWRPYAGNSGAHLAGRAGGGDRSGRIGAIERPGDAGVIWVAPRLRPGKFSRGARNCGSARFYGL